MDSPSSDRDPLEQLAHEFLEQRRNGGSLSIDAFAELHPQWADDIRELFPTILAVEQAKLERRQSAEQAAAPFRLKQLGDFRLVGEIGRGGMGIVYEAVQESLGRHVALKVLPKQALWNEKHLRRFRREAQTAAALHHTNIVPVFGVGEQDGYHYYVMQYIRGVGLDEVLETLRRFRPGNTSTTRGDESTVAADGRTPRSAHAADVAEALLSGEFVAPRPWDSAESTGSAPTLHLPARPTPPKLGESAVPERSRGPNSSGEYFRSVAHIGLQVADALHYAHTHGTLHRDIKPANLLIDNQGVTWVADFGLAKALEHEDLSRTGDIVGTLRYMAPEQFHGQADVRSDLFSLGLTFYELLTLEPAYSEQDRKRMLLDPSAAATAEPLRRRNPAIPRDLETIVLKAIAPLPEQRYGSAAELHADLQRFLDDRPVKARRATAAERAWRWCRRNRAVASLSAVAFLLLLLVAAVASVGYVRTNRALVAESQQRQKAETTLGISLEALDKIYQRFAPDRLFEVSDLYVASVDGQEIQVSGQAVLSAETAQLLEDILGFYDRFAEQDSDNAQLQMEAAKANRRVGDIYQRLGRAEPARSAYERAIATYRQVESRAGDPGRHASDIARIYNELGNVERSQRRGLEALEAYRQALGILEPLAGAATADEEVLYELARTHFLLGRSAPTRSPGPEGPGPRGPRGPFRDGLRDGSRDGRGREGREPDGREGRGREGWRDGFRDGPRGGGGRGREGGRPFGELFYLGGPFRGEERGDFGPGDRRPGDPAGGDAVPEFEPPGFRPGPLRPGGRFGQGNGPQPRRTDEQLQHLQRALEILKELQAANPEVPDYLHLIALCYRELRDPFPAAESQQAIATLEELCRAYPQVAEYHFDLCQTYADIDFFRLRETDLPEAKQRMEKALQTGKQLVAQHPNEPAFLDMQIQTQLQLAMLLRLELRLAGRGDSEPSPPGAMVGSKRAEQLLRQAVELQQLQVDRSPDVLPHRLWLAMLRLALADALRTSGEAPQLAEARRILEDSVMELVELRDASEMRFLNGPLHQHYRLLAEVLRQSGDESDARIMQQRASELRGRFR